MHAYAYTYSLYIQFIHTYIHTLHLVCHIVQVSYLRNTYVHTYIHTVRTLFSYYYFIPQNPHTYHTCNRHIQYNELLLCINPIIFSPYRWVVGSGTVVAALDEAVQYTKEVRVTQYDC